MRVLRLEQGCCWSEPGCSLLWNNRLAQGTLYETDDLPVRLHQVI